MTTPLTSSPARLSRRQLLWALRAAAVAAVLPVSLWPVVPAQALDFKVAQMRQSMLARFGEGGVQRLEAWLAMLDQQAGRSVQGQLKAVNDFWNQNVVGSEDILIWGEQEYWATPLETLGKRQGDCEDYVIGKYFSLQRLGVPVEKLRFIYVRARVGGMGSTQSIAHMVLGYYETPQSEPLVLDNLMGNMLPASQRKDLTPVFSFNAQGIYVTGAQPASVERISRWKGLLARMQQEGFTP
ncbi:transglutaminase-like cysteine peptidase [Comamonas sp. GB3 AK4-5]|uniref:transglutaminase-like cysteine peptidase n=1 Tax=Comamonas sp. GB3 AK4-5 TaxID=3231487 RepID=UPI00351DB783